MIQQSSYPLWIFDKQGYSADHLAEICRRIPSLDVQVNDGRALLAKALPQEPFLCLFNCYLDDADDAIYQNMAKIRKFNSKIPMFVIVAPVLGEAALKRWEEKFGRVDVKILKPVPPDTLVQTLSQYVVSWQNDLALKAEVERLALMQPSQRWLHQTSHMKPGDAVFTNMTVLITDIRQSTQRIVRDDPRQYLESLNHWLSVQTELVYKYEGVVIKFTGDGMLAIFEGSARNYLAIKCAQKIIQGCNQSNLLTGIGIADGLVLGGLIGSHLRYQFDITGSTVHMASRLCGEAKPWEIITQAACLEHVYLDPGTLVASDMLMLRGFDQAVEVRRISEEEK